MVKNRCFLEFDKVESQLEARGPIFQLSKYENVKLFKYETVFLLWNIHLKTLSMFIVQASHNESLLFTCMKLWIFEKKL